MTKRDTWFKQYRQDWIKEMLEIYGFINRAHITRKFQVSIQQASIDLNRFRKDNPDFVEYDLSAKQYVRQSDD